MPPGKYRKAIKACCRGRFSAAERSREAEAAKIEAERQVAVAGREKNIQPIKASKEAEPNAISVELSASAEKDAAPDRAEAATMEATAKPVLVGPQERHSPSS